MIGTPSLSNLTHSSADAGSSHPVGAPPNPFMTHLYTQRLLTSLDYDSLPWSLLLAQGALDSLLEKLKMLES